MAKTEDEKDLFNKLAPHLIELDLMSESDLANANFRMDISQLVQEQLATPILLAETLASFLEREGTRLPHTTRDSIMSDLALMVKSASEVIGSASRVLSQKTIDTYVDNGIRVGQRRGRR